MKHVFITGATGFVGINLIKAILKNSDAVLYLLVRGTKECTAEDRMKNLLKEYYPQDQNPKYFQRIHAINGDICVNNLGMPNDIWDELSQKIDTIFHCAATVHFNLPYEEASEINLIGTRRVLALASKCHENKVLHRLNHISTAFIGGKTKRFYETDCDIGQEFTNTYEQTKFETELEILKYIGKGLPVMIFRPSIVAGNHKTGEIPKGSILFTFIQSILNGSFKEFICNDDSEINIVPVDYVVDAMLHITKSDANLGKAFNLVNRKNNNVKQMIINCCKLLSVEPPKIHSIENKKDASKFTRMALSMFIDYMDICHTFDDTVAEAALQGSGIVCPTIGENFSAALLRSWKP
jgi:thioester reductase-like protein